MVGSQRRVVHRLRGLLSLALVAAFVTTTLPATGRTETSDIWSNSDGTRSIAFWLTVKRAADDQLGGVYGGQGLQ